jgi:hypothetical protein
MNENPRAKATQSKTKQNKATMQTKTTQNKSKCIIFLCNKYNTLYID